MEYNRSFVLKNGKICVLRNGTESDAQEVLSCFNLAHGQTDYLLSYPDECRFTLEQEAQFLKEKTENKREIEILAETDGKVVGSGGISLVGSNEKVKHRAEFGISVDQAFWGLGIGRALTQACIECARMAGYSQLELEAVAENERAVKLYQSIGFVEYGRNPKGFRSRFTGWQELILMRLDMEG